MPANMESGNLWWHYKNPPSSMGFSRRDLQYLVDRAFSSAVFRELSVAYGGDTRVMKRCPECGAYYFPDLPRGEGSKEQREQHITGICSTECWSDHVGFEDTELDVVRSRMRIHGIQKAVLA